jgi:hypothetical protein
MAKGSVKSEKKAKNVEVESNEVEEVEQSEVEEKTTKTAKSKTSEKSKKSTKTKSFKDSKTKSKTEKKSATKSKTAPKKGGSKKTKTDDEEEGKKSRSFKAIYVDPEGELVYCGRYCGVKPKQAACKALTGIFKTYKQANKKVSEVKFGVVETTRNSKHKKYWYSGLRKKLEEPVEVTINKNGKEDVVTYKFENKVKKITEDECPNLSKCDPKEVATEDEEDVKKGGSKKAKSTKSTKSAKSSKGTKGAETETKKSKTSKSSTGKSEKKTAKKTEEPVEEQKKGKKEAKKTEKKADKKKEAKKTK